MSATAQEPLKKDPYIIYGFIFDENGRRVPQVNITIIETQTKQIINSIADENGKYKIVIDNYKIGDTIRILATDGKRSGINITILKEGAAVQVNVTLTQVFLSGFTLQYTLFALGIGLFFLLKKRQ
jgi:hypothetical protein